MSKKLLFVAALMLVAVIAFAQPWPPMNLEADVVDQTNVSLTWGAPQDPNSVELRYDDGVNYDGIGTNSANDFDVAIRFETSDLASYDGYALYQVGFFPRYADCEYSIRVWTGGSVNGTTINSGTMVVDQAVDTFTIEEWNYVTLETALTIDADEELWIGYRANTQGDHPAGCDEGPAVAYKGDLLNLGGWFSMVTEYANLDYNWNIVGMATAERAGGELIPLTSPERPAVNTEVAIEREFRQVSTPRDRELTGYAVYRDGENVATVDDAETLTYLDEDLEDGTYSYYVSALWDEGESEGSNNVEVVIEALVAGTLEGTVTDADTNAPIEGAVIVAGTASGTTNASGEYSFEVDEGTYDVSCSAAGYMTYVEEDVVITADQTETVDFELAAASEFPAPTNFEATVVNDVNVQLSWNSPFTELRYDDGENYDGIGTNSATDFDVAIRFDTSDLDAFDGLSLNQVGFFPRYEDCDYYVRVWTGGSVNGTNVNAGSMIVDQEVDVTIDQWNYFTLNTPVMIDASEELWIGFRANTGGDHPAGCDAGPAVAYKSDLLNLGGWFSLVTEYPNLNYNWNIVGFATGGRGCDDLVPLASSPRNVDVFPAFEQEHTNIITPEPLNRNRDLEGYKIYRNGEQIAFVEDAFQLDYLDEALEPGTYTYYATAVYNNAANESAPSNSDEVEIEELEYDPPEMLEATVNGFNVLLQWDAPGTNQEAVDSISEDFEDAAIPEGWSLINNDGDAYNWEILDGTNWGEAHSGEYMIGSASFINDIGALTPDNWLITPPIAIQGGYELSFWVAAVDGDWPAEHYEVLLSTTGAGVNDFDVTLHEETLSSTVWHEVTVDLSDYAGQNCRIAFVHNEVTDVYWMRMDDVYVNNARGEAVFGFGEPSENIVGSRKNDGSVYVAPVHRDRPTVGSYNIYRDDQYHATQNNVNITVYNDVNVPAGGHSYYVTAVYTDGNESGPSNIVNITNNDPGNVPAFTALEGNYPNPFNPVTTIHFSLKQQSDVTIEVYNLKGQLVRTLVNEKMEAGSHQVQWTGNDSNGKNVGSGVYFYKMKAGRYTSTKKMILLK